MSYNKKDRPSWVKGAAEDQQLSIEDKRTMIFAGAKTKKVNSTFAIGDQVVEKESLKPHTSFCVYKVVLLSEDYLLLEHYGTAYQKEVEPDDFDSEVGSQSWRSSVLKFDRKELISLEESWNELDRLEAAKSNLENEFKMVQNQIKANLNQAATLVTEALAMASSVKKDFDDLTNEMRPLVQAIKKSGWRMSTISCM